VQAGQLNGNALAYLHVLCKKVIQLQGLACQQPTNELHVLQRDMLLLAQAAR